MNGIGRRPLRGLLVGAAVLLAAGCGASSPPAGTPPPGAVVVTAVDLEFAPNPVTAPADEAFVLYFENRDTVLHNAKVVNGSGSTVIPGELFTGPSARVANAPALAAGTYRIVCDVHPDMQGELIAAP